MDGDGRLVVGSGGEDLALVAWYRGVGIYEFGHHASHGLDTHGEWSNVEQNDVALVTRENGTLYAGTNCHYLVGVDTLAGFLAEEVGHEFLDSRYTA